MSGEGSVGLSIVPLAALLTGAVFTLGIAVLLVAVLAVRRRRDPHHHHHHHGAPHQMELEAVKQQKVPPTGGLQPASRQNSLLEINHGEHRYVVSYTLKSAADCGQEQQQPSERQPDILNTPRGKWRTQVNQQKRGNVLLRAISNYLSLGTGTIMRFLCIGSVSLTFSYKVKKWEILQERFLRTRHFSICAGKRENSKSKYSYHILYSLYNFITYYIIICFISIRNRIYCIAGF